MKTCTKCGTSKEIDLFYKRTRSSDGHSSWCKECHDTYGKTWNKERVPPTVSVEYEKICRTCSETKPAADFHKNKFNKDGLRTDCVECVSKYGEQYYVENKEHLNDNSNRWFNENRERHAQIGKECKLRSPEKYQATERSSHLSRKYGMTLTDYEFLWEIQKGLCALCGTDKPGGKGRFHVDHVHVENWKALDPKSRRSHVRGLLCWSCNSMLGHGKENPALFSEKVIAYINSRPFAIGTDRTQQPSRQPHE